MTHQEFEIINRANRINERYKWERMCGECRYMGNTEWSDGLKSHNCTHPDRQDGFSDPRPFGCQGSKFEKHRTR